MCLLDIWVVAVKNKKIPAPWSLYSNRKDEDGGVRPYTNVYQVVDTVMKRETEKLDWGL